MGHLPVGVLSRAHRAGGSHPSHSFLSSDCCCCLQTSLMAALDTISDAACELVAAQHVVVFLADRTRQELWANISSGGDGSGQQQPAMRTVRVRVGSGAIGECAAQRQQVALDLMGTSPQQQQPQGQPHQQQQQQHPDAGLLELLAAMGVPDAQGVLLQPVLDPADEGADVLAVLCAVNKVGRVPVRVVRFGGCKAQQQQCVMGPAVPVLRGSAV